MKILFICTANICRSALAEVILKKKLIERGRTDIEVESAGIRNYEGRQRDEKMESLARKAGYEMGGAARYASQDLLESADLIICMENFQVVEIQKRLPYMFWERLYRFNVICFGEQTDLADPSGNTDYIYQYSFDTIEAGCEILAQRLAGPINKG